MKIIDLIKKNLLGFIVGAIVFGSIGAYALTVASKDVTYNNTNVESAINDLYSKVGNSSTLKRDSFIASSNGGSSANSTKLTIDVGFEYTMLHVWVITSNGGGLHNLYIYDKDTNYEFTQTPGNAVITRTATTFTFQNSSWYNGCTIYYLAVK